MRKMKFLPAKTKAQISSSNCKADQRLCFRYTDSTTPLLLISKISSFLPASVTGLCPTLSETPKTVFLVYWLIFKETHLKVTELL